MKDKLYAVVGIWIIIFVLLCPLPPVFGVPGLLWRLIIGLFGLYLSGKSILKISNRKKRQ